MALILRAPSALTDPLPSTPRYNDPFYSDTFTGPAGPIVGRVTDSGLGGLPATWQVYEQPAGAGLQVGGGAARRDPGTHDPATTTWAAGLPAPEVSSYEVEFDLDAYPTSSLYVCVYREPLHQQSDYVRITIDPQGGIRTAHSIGQDGLGSTTSFTTNAPLGSRIAFGTIDGTEHYLTINDVLAGRSDNPEHVKEGPGYVAILGLLDAQGFELRNLQVNPAREL